MNLRSTLPLALLLVSAVGCKMVGKDKSTGAAPSAAAPTASTAPATSAPSAAVAKRAPRKPEMAPTFPVEGPIFMVLPGEGLSTIRFGATRETIERQMEAPCQVVEESWCHYFHRGLSFRLDKDSLVEVRAFRPNRSTSRPSSDPYPIYRTFHGRIEPDVTFLMSASGAQEGLGKPQRIEKVTEKNDTDTVERHYYEGMVAEFDHPDFANEPILGAVIVTKSDKAKAARLARRLGRNAPPAPGAK